MHDMQQPQDAQRTLATLLGLAAGASGFLLSFILAMLVLIRQGNPGFLIIWLLAFVATAACMRAHAKWRKSFERMYSPDSVRTFHPARKGWKHNVEDVVFRDIPDASMSFSQ